MPYVGVVQIRNYVRKMRLCNTIEALRSEACQKAKPENGILAQGIGLTG